MKAITKNRNIRKYESIFFVGIGVKNASRVLLTQSEAEKGKLENFDFVLLSSFASRKSKSIGCI